MRFIVDVRNHVLVFNVHHVFGVLDDVDVGILTSHIESKLEARRQTKRLILSPIAISDLCQKTILL